MNYIIKDQKEKKEKTVEVYLEKFSDGVLRLWVGRYMVFALRPDGTARLFDGITEGNPEGIQVDEDFGHIELRD